MKVYLNRLEILDVWGLHWEIGGTKRGVDKGSVFYDELPEGEKYEVVVLDSDPQVLVNVISLAQERDDIVFAPVNLTSTVVH